MDYFKPGKTGLPQGFIQNNSGRIGKIERTGSGIIQHRNFDTGIRITVMHMLGQTGSFFAEHNKIAILELYFVIMLAGFGGG